MSELNSVIKGNEIYENHLDEDPSYYIGAKLTYDLKSLERLEAALSEVEGQAHVVEAIKEALFGVQQKQKSSGVLASFMFMGPPASGKSLISEKIAEALGIPYKRLDMSSYCTKDASMDFSGLNASFKSSKPGDATEFVYNNPYCVLVLDEIEKAHITILHQLYQILEQGEIEDLTMKKVVNFRNVILVLTSNLGASIYDGDISNYNNSQVSQSTIIKALTSEINPQTGVPYLPSALVSRLSYGRIVLFNRLRPEHIHNIVKGAINKELAVYKERYRIEINVDVDELAKTFIFSLGENADIRALLQMARGFFETYFLRSVNSAKENNSKKYFSRISCSFDKSNASDEVQELFFKVRKSRLAVFCDENEKVVFDGLDKDFVDVFYISEDFKLKDILRTDASAIIIGINEQNERLSKELFLEASLQDKIPIYIYSNNKIGKLPFLYYTDKGATDCYYPEKTDKNFDAWLQDILNGINLTSITQEIFRANKILTYDVSINYSEAKREILLLVTNYGIRSAMSASDSDKFVAARSIPDVKFDDIIGAKEAKSELMTVVKMLKNFKELKREGIRIPRGVLLEGKPGTGKTMLAKALAAECKMPFIEKNGSEFLQKHVGSGAEKMQELFATARRYAPSVIFIDEVDVFAGNRESMSGFRTDDILNAFLSEMDGFGDKSDTPVFVIVATNFSSDRNDTKLDPAFLRRFDRSIVIDLPSFEERREFLTKSLKKLGRNVVSEKLISSLSKRSVGLSLADINLVIQNAIRKCYTGNGIEVLTDEILKEAYENYVDGGVNEQKESDLKQTAIHEAGHCIVANILRLKPTYITIVGRKRYGGYVSFSNEDESTYSKDFLLNKICCAYAGRVAEVREYGSSGITTGIGQDIKTATHLAELMVAEYGMCDSDIMYYSVERRSADPEILGRIRDILKEQYSRAEQLVEQNYEKVKRLANVLLEKNSLDEEEIISVLEGDNNAVF